MGAAAIKAHHIGSTSIPNILAKPIIDILIEARSLEAVDARSQQMVDVGYEAMGEYEISGRRYFRKSNASGVRTHHVHIFQTGSEHIIRHIAFRDYLRAHPAKAKSYSDLNRALIAEPEFDPCNYSARKAPFIQMTQEEAMKRLQEAQKKRASLELFILLLRR